jgi:hypothetical protein
VTIHDTSALETIMDSAFYYTALESIVIPESVMNIGREAFWAVNSDGDRTLTSASFNGTPNWTVYDWDPGDYTTQNIELTLNQAGPSGTHYTVVNAQALYTYANCTKWTRNTT